MKPNVAKRFSEKLTMIRDCYYNKHMGLPCKESDLQNAVQYLTITMKNLQQQGNPYECAFLSYCFDTLQAIIAENNDAKASRFAHAIRDTALIFSGDKKWNKKFREEYFAPFRGQYGNAYFSELWEMQIPPSAIPPKKVKAIYQYDQKNLFSLGEYIVYRLLFPIIFLSVTLLLVLILSIDEHFAKRYELRVESYTYSNTLTLHCEGYEQEFSVPYFEEFSTDPEKLIQLCEAGKPLIAYANFISSKYGDYYEIVRLEDQSGNVYRNAEHTNQSDAKKLSILIPIWIFLIAYSAIIVAAMLYIAYHPQKFKFKPRLVKFFFPKYSLSSKYRYC